MCLEMFGEREGEFANTFVCVCVSVCFSIGLGADAPHSHKPGAPPFMRALFGLPPIVQMLYFSFNERPQEMFDRVVEIKVLNAKKVIRDALLGSFKVRPVYCLLRGVHT